MCASAENDRDFLAGPFLDAFLGFELWTRRQWLKHSKTAVMRDISLGWREPEFQLNSPPGNQVDKHFAQLLAPRSRYAQKKSNRPMFLPLNQKNWPHHSLYCPDSCPNNTKYDSSPGDSLFALPPAGTTCREQRTCVSPLHKHPELIRCGSSR